MIYRIAHSFRFLTRALIAESTPRQIAMGFSMGIMIGLVPKSNLIAAGLIVLLFSMRVNILAGLLSAAVVSLIAPALDPVLHHFGNAILTVNPLQPLYAQLYELPLVPWTQFNNTVVAGGLFLGLIQLFPTYRVLRPYVQRRLPAWSRLANRFLMGRVLFGNEVATGWRVA